SRLRPLRLDLMVPRAPPPPTAHAAPVCAATGDNGAGWLEGNTMKLSLSVRIAELENRKDHAFMPIEELAPLARAVGFEGLSMRASVVSVDSPPERVAEVRSVLDQAGLAVSMVTGDVPLAANRGDVVRILREPGPYVALAQALGCNLLRVMVRSDDEVEQL